MPSRNKIYSRINKLKASAQDNIRREYIKDLHNYTKRDTIIYSSAFTTINAKNIPAVFLGIDSDDIHGFMSALYKLKDDKLDLIIHSPGGSAEVAEQIVKYLRAKYKHIRAIVPQNAMSAATMIACACDVIIMGKHSAIGPIDPQIIFSTPTGQFSAPAQAILDEFNMAKSEVAQNPKTAPLFG